MGTDIQPARIVIAGGGVAAFEAAIALRALAGDAPAITLVAPGPDFVYQPMSVGEPFAMGEAPHLPLAEFANDLDVEWRQGSVQEVGKTRAVVLDDDSFIVYDRLIIALGAPREAVYEHANTFRGETDAKPIHGLIQDIELGVTRSVAFVVPNGVAWPLPIYELGLMTARRAYEMEVEVELTLVTPEDRPLSVFGAHAAAEVETRLKDAGIRLITSANAEVPAKGHIVVHPGDEQIDADRIIALPISRGPAIAGVPSDRDGFIPIDSHARVTGAADIYAAGDVTNFPVKQGGIACQHADAAAEHIAASLGAEIDPQPFRAVLRGQLLTGDAPPSMPWAGTKVAGKYLSGYLLERSQEGERGRPSLAPLSEEGGLEIPLRGYEYAGRWSGQ